MQRNEPYEQWKKNGVLGAVMLRRSEGNVDQRMRCWDLNLLSVVKKISLGVSL